jgi:N-acetylglutamate synthase-like GNAT family acetyltransferase
VLAVGEMGLLVGPDVVDTEPAQLADALIDRAIDYCRRSQFRHIFCVDGQRANLLAARGFSVVGDYAEFLLAGR